jgi:hypothetical protein
MQTHLNDMRRRAADKLDLDEEDWTTMRSGKLTHVVPQSLQAHLERCAAKRDPSIFAARLRCLPVAACWISRARSSLTPRPSDQRGCGKPAGPARL